jgi:hypothetical protein
MRKLLIILLLLPGLSNGQGISLAEVCNSLSLQSSDWHDADVYYYDNEATSSSSVTMPVLIENGRVVGIRWDDKTFFYRDSLNGYGYRGGYLKEELVDESLPVLSTIVVASDGKRTRTFCIRFDTFSDCMAIKKSSEALSLKK